MWRQKEFQERQNFVKTVVIGGGGGQKTAQ